MFCLQTLKVMFHVLCLFFFFFFLMYSLVLNCYFHVCHSSELPVFKFSDYKMSM